MSLPCEGIMHRNESSGSCEYEESGSEDRQFSTGSVGAEMGCLRFENEWCVDPRLVAPRPGGSSSTFTCTSAFLAPTTILLTMTFQTSRDSNGTITVAPRNEADQSATIVLCHGLGDSAQGWEDVAEVRGDS